MGLFDTFTSKTNQQTTVANTDSYNNTTTNSLGIADSNNLNLSINKASQEESQLEKFVPMIIAGILILFAISLFKKRS